MDADEDASSYGVVFSFDIKSWRLICDAEVQ